MPHSLKSLSTLLTLVASIMCLAGCGSDSNGGGAGTSGTAGDSGGAAGTGTTAGSDGSASGIGGGAGSDGAAGTSGGAGDSDGTAGTGASGTGAAGSGSGEPGTDCGLGLAAPANGFQVCTKGTEIKAMEDTEYCEVVTLPGSPSDTYYVNRLETQMTNYSHHLIIMAAEAGTTADGAMTDGKRVGCIGGEQAFGSGLSHVAGAQRPYSDAAYPSGVGKIYHGGQKLSFDYHYFNVSDKPVIARAALNVHLVDKEDVEHVAHQFGFYNYAIFIQQGKSAGFELTCTATADIMVQALTRHTHQWGRDFTVWAKGGANDGDMLWTTPDYEGETTYVLPGGPLLLKKGEGYKFRCDFENTTDHLLTFGVNATDEMCILFGSWWKVNESDSVPTGSMSCKFPQ